MPGHALEHLRAVLASHRENLDRWGIGSISVFGSVARGDDGPASDVDLLVEFSRPVGLFHFVGVRMELEALLGRRVDLVTKDALHPKMRDRILREAIRAA